MDNPSPTDDFTTETFEAVKQQFRDIDCLVSDFSDTHFEIVHDQFPVRTLVHPNPYYIEYSTVIWARPGGLLQRFRKQRDAFLNTANLTGHVTKFTCDSRSLDRDMKAWEILASARMVPGTVSVRYPTESIDHWTMLWLQDLAKVIRLEGDFELIAMLQRSGSKP